MTESSPRTREPSLRQRAVRRLLGDRPEVLFFLVAPTLLAIAMDVCIRPRSLVDFPPRELFNYFGSSLAACGFWGGPLWLMARLAQSPTRAAKVAFYTFFSLIFFPVGCFSYGGQAIFYGVFRGYMNRDTVRLGIQLRGTLGAWLAAWGAAVAIMIVSGLVVTVVVAVLVRRAGKPLAVALPIVPTLGFVAATTVFSVDFVESRALQAAPPDTCFLHGIIATLRRRIVKPQEPPRGVSIRTPAPLPRLTTPAHRPNVVLILTESVRADALCSASTFLCRSTFLDGVAPRRMSLGRLTAQSSGTFSSCMTLWTGLAPDADFLTAHRAPMLWELARAVGYRTAYVTSQNLRYEDLGVYVQNAAIDFQVSAVDLGDTHDPHLGAPDESAMERAIAFVRQVAATGPYFLLLHLSNTHWPYRIDPALQPYSPHNESPFGPIEEMHNHYRNSVLMQERALSLFLKELRATPRWDDTAVLFLSDHGETFREHGRLYHLNTLFDEEVRVPGFLDAGDRAIDSTQRFALTAQGDRRTYTEDVHATVVDLFGLHDRRGDIPYAERRTGRSLLRWPPRDNRAVLMSTSSGIWDDDDPRFGAMRGEQLLVGATSHPWQCYDGDQWRPLAPRACGELLDIAKEHFPDAHVPEP